MDFVSSIFDWESKYIIFEELPLYCLQKFIIILMAVMKVGLN